MKQILVLGAGRSCTSLIEYLIRNSVDLDWHIRVGDYDLPTAQEKCGNSSRAEAFHFDINHADQCDLEVQKVDLVISMLPAAYHPKVARSCVRHGVHMLTASYISDEMKALNQEARENGVLAFERMRPRSWHRSYVCPCG